MAGGKIDILVNPDVADFPGKLESGLQSSLATAGKIGAALGLSIGAAATAKSVFELGVEFDKQMNTLAAVSQASATQLEAVEARARELGKSTDLTATSASDAAAAMTELSKGGFSVEEAMNAAKGTLQLASAAQVDAAEAAAIQAQALQAFGLDASYAANAADVLAGAANASSADIGGIAQGLQQAGAVSHQFGISLEDTATGLAMFANAGIQGSDAGTLLKSALLHLTARTAPAQAAVEELGLTVYDTTGKFIGMESIFGQLHEASARMTDEQYQAATATLFGSDAMRLAGVAAREGAEGWRETSAAVTRAGQASEVAAAQAQGLPGVLEAIENQAEDTGLAIYDAFKGISLGVGEQLVAGIEAAGPVVEATAAEMAALVEALGPGISAATDMAGAAIGQVVDALGVLGGAAKATVGGLADWLSPVASGLGAVSDGLSSVAGPAAAAATALAVSKWQNFGGALEVAGGSVKKNTIGILELARLHEALATRVSGSAKVGKEFGDVQANTSVTARGLSSALQAQVPWIGRAAESYRTYGAEMRTNAANHRRWAEEISISSGEVHTLAANMHRGHAVLDRFNGTLVGGLAAGASVARSALGGLVNALGGPLNVAIAAAAFAITGITNEISKTRTSKRLLEELGDAAKITGRSLYEAMSQGDMGAQIAALDTGLTSLIEKQKQLSATAPGAFSIFSAAGKDIAGWVTGKGFNAGTDERRAQQEAAREAELFSEAIEKAGISAQEAATAVGGTAAQYDALISRLDLSTDGGQAAAEALARQRDEFHKMQALVDSLAPGSVEIAEALGVIGDVAADSKSKVAALSRALDEIFGVERTGDEALAELHEQIEQITESAEQAVDQMKGFGESLFGGDGRLDMSKANARALQDEILGMRSALEQVAVTGEDVDEAFGYQQAALQSLADRYGLSKAKVDELAASMGLVPSTIKATVSVATDPALKGLGEVWAAIQTNQVEAGKPVTIHAENVEETKAQIEELGWTIGEVTSLEDGSGSIEFTADTQQAIDQVDLLVQAAAELNTEHSITFTSNSEEQVRAIADLGIGIEELDDGSYKITSNTPEQIKLMIELGLLVKDEKTGKVTVTDNLQEVLDRGKELDKRHGKETKETHYVDRIERTWTEYYTSGRHASTSGVSVGQHYADGGLRAADGLLSNQQAQIAPGGSWLVWAEDETQGESFIPHAPAKRARATQIMAATADIFGLGLIDADGNRITRDGTPVGPLTSGAVKTFANGGIVESITGLVRKHFPMMKITSTYRNTNDHHGAGKAVDFSNGYDTTPEMQAAARWFYTNYKDQLAELIHWPLNGWTNVKNGQHLNYGEPTNSQHRNHVHIAAHAPLGAPGTASITEDMRGSMDGLSVGDNAVRYSYQSQKISERNVNWGEASDLNRLARRSLGIYDQGGWLPVGGMAVNLGAKPEPVFSPAQWALLSRVLDSVPQLVTALRQGNLGGAQASVGAMSASVLGDVAAAAKRADEAVLAFGETVGGDMVSRSALVQDAERGLVETRKGLAEESAALIAQEREVRLAREHLSKVQAEGGEISKSTARKLEDAERKLSEARKDGKANRIADAERSLSRAREDAADQMAKSEEKNAQDIQKARETVAKAEADLAEMRELSESAAKRLEAAERTVIAARYQVLANLAGTFADALSVMESSVRSFYGAVAEHARAMEATRQQLIAERLEVSRLGMARQRSQLDAILAEQELARVKAQSAISVANAEAHLSGIRTASMASGAEAAKKGATGIDAMSLAMDRARVTGRFAVEDVAAAQVRASGSVSSAATSHSAQILQAEHNVAAVKAQTKLDELTAAHQHRLAVLAVAEATILQQQAVALMEVSTQQLAAQAERLGGMTSAQAESAAGGWGGLGQAFGGLGKLGEAILAGVTGFAAGGPVGAAVAVLPKLQSGIEGLFDAFTGAREAWNNREEIKVSLEGMSGWDKFLTIGGLVLSGGAAIGGAVAGQQYGAPAVEVGIKASAAILEQTAKMAQTNLNNDMARINREAEHLRQQITERSQAELHRIEQARHEAEMNYATESVALSAEAEIAELLGQIAAATTVDQANALQAAAEVAAERRDQMLALLGRQVELAEKQAAAPKPTLVVNIPPGAQTVDRVEFDRFVDAVAQWQTDLEVQRTSVGSTAYVQART